MTKQILDVFKKKTNFNLQLFMEKPQINVTYMVTIAEKKEEAEFEARPQDIWRIMNITEKGNFHLNTKTVYDFVRPYVDI